MEKSISVFLLALSLFTGIKAQKAEIALKEYFIDAEYFFVQEYYADALQDFVEIYRRGYSENANLNYRIGICYLNLPGQKQKSIEYLLKAKESASLKYKESTLNEELAPIDVYLYLGNAYRVNDKLDEAIASYNKYKELLPVDEVNLHNYANKQIEACNIANEFMRNPKPIQLNNIGSNINSSRNESKCVVAGNGSVLVFMRSLPFYDAVYVSKMKNGTWGEPENITPQLLSDGDQFVTSISYDGKKIFLTKEDEFNSDIYVSDFVENRWTPSKPLGDGINTKFWESHASISKDASKLYFTSNRKESIGEMDIFVSTITPDGSFGPAKNIGSPVNTELNEDTPFISEDGTSLFFSSQGFMNMGGYDYFVSHLQGDTAWSTPENLGYPLSTTDDDLFFFPWNNGEVGYLSRIDEGFGGTDIYFFGMVPEILEPIAEQVNEPVIPPAPTSNIEAPVTIPIVAVPVIETAKEQIATKEPEILPVAVTAPIQIKTVEISPILFDFDKTQLSAKGKEELQKLVNLMKEFHELNSILVGYTDALGPDSYNLSLSEKRALEAIKYLTSQGIEAARLKAIGKGEVDFIAPNAKPDGSDYPEGRKYNRRIEFEINGVNEKTLVLKRFNPVPDEIKQ